MTAEEERLVAEVSVEQERKVAWYASRRLARALRASGRTAACRGDARNAREAGIPQDTGLSFGQLRD